MGLLISSIWDGIQLIRVWIQKQTVTEFVIFIAITRVHPRMILYPDPRR